MLEAGSTPLWIEKIEAQQNDVFKASAIVVLERTDCTGQVIVTPCSGFLVDLGEHWIWITAGHVIEELDKWLTAGMSRTYLFSLPLDKMGPIHLNYQQRNGITTQTFIELVDHSHGSWTDEQKEIMRHRRLSDLGFILLTDNDV